MVNISFDFNLFNNYYYFYERLVVLLFSLIPTLLLVGFVLYTDRKSREPSKNIIICLLSGILTVALAGYLEELVMPYFSNSVILTYVWGFIEELSKIAIFFLFIFDNKHYDDIYDGVVYMTLIALSFAGLENIMYAFSENTVSESISLALMRDFTTIPLHVICGVVIGYFVSLGNFSKDKAKKYINFLLAILISSLIHGTYNNLMSFLGKINVNYNNSIEVLLLQALPLILIMIGLFIIAIKFSKKAIILDKIYIENASYDKKYNYLMTYSEYLDSNDRRKRVMMHNKTTFNNKEE
ncbi:MAG: PrsW family intramembrane metalloprotease [Candidatus Aphodocola sp.]